MTLMKPNVPLPSLSYPPWRGKPMNAVRYATILLNRVRVKS